MTPAIRRKTQVTVTAVMVVVDVSVAEVIVIAVNFIVMVSSSVFSSVLFPIDVELVGWEDVLSAIIAGGGGVVMIVSGGQVDSVS